VAFTARSAFAAVAEELARGDEEFALRTTIMATNELRDAIVRGDVEVVAAYLADGPATTGSQRWDTLLAGQISRHLRLAGIERPPWLHPEPLCQFWFVNLASPLLVARTIQRTSPDLWALGVFLDDSSFETA
jgi:hypothetical protein